MQTGIRIIGGRWRGRKIRVPSAPGLRPTPDRIRETVFNWLTAGCRDAVVLDCFAGSGALGFEALSRGAAKLVMLESNANALDGLRRTAERFDIAAIEIVRGNALESIPGLDEQFDLVFIDPPYARGELRNAAIRRLEETARLNPGARVYFEWPAGEDFCLPSKQLVWLKHGLAGQVNYAIAEWNPSG